MQPEINPNYFMQYMQQQQNPYMNNRLANLQQFQQSLQPQQAMQPNYLGGKVVDSIDVVKVADIPTDGNLYYFPKADGTEIYVKNWNPNGTTRILTYKPVFDSNTTNLSTEPEKFNYEVMESYLNVFMGRFDSLEERFSKLEQSWTNSSTKSQKSSIKKEVDVE